MVVNNLGYLKLDAVLKLEHFSIYETHKDTHVLVVGGSDNNVALYYPKQDRLPWKTVEGKKICHGVKIFDSKINALETIDTTKWNNGNQIMAYNEFCSF